MYIIILCILHVHYIYIIIHVHVHYIIHNYTCRCTLHIHNYTCTCACTISLQLVLTVDCHVITVEHKYTNSLMVVAYLFVQQVVFTTIMVHKCLHEIFVTLKACGAII